MNKIDTVELLAKDYALTDNQKDILKFLSQFEATAEEIVKKTTVSNGRIYKILREFELWGIIDKSKGKPSIYGMKNFSLNIRNFLDNKLKKNMESQKQIISGLTEIDSSSKVSVLSGSNKDFDIEIINMFNQAKNIKILHKHISLPWFLYCFFREDDFLKIRDLIAKTRVTGSSREKFDLLQKRNAYLEIYKNKKIEQIMLKKILIDYLKLLNKYQIKLIKENIRTHPNVKIYVLDNLNTPFSVYLSDREVLMPIFTKKQNRMIKMQGKEYISIYEEYVESFTKGARVISDFIN
ncbi:MAG: helix-turn-helix domain-containing protein [Patescibacteria group bacterium]